MKLRGRRLMLASSPTISRRCGRFTARRSASPSIGTAGGWRLQAASLPRQWFGHQTDGFARPASAPPSRRLRQTLIIATNKVTSPEEFLRPRR